MIPKLPLMNLFHNEYAYALLSKYKQRSFEEWLHIVPSHFLQNNNY